MTGSCFDDLVIAEEPKHRVGCLAGLPFENPALKRESVGSAGDSVEPSRAACPWDIRRSRKF